MSDIIKLLPDAVANQIAAGEVVQRPASAVKELIENAIDAGADKIQLIVKEAGKALIQVIDNGFGMSVTDARMCLERHATSKITQAEDLFAIRTMGFRGEAMASIAAIAQMKIKTRKHNQQLGTCLQVEGSKVLSQEACSCPAGTNISVKNLFYNIPARRNFLKSNPSEMRYIIDEFTRVALAHSSIHFTLHHDGQEVFHLPQTQLKQRIIHVLGNNYNEKLVPLDEETNVIKVKGFIGKPSFAKRTRGEQFFFVNNRFIKDSYLNHAVTMAYQGLLPPDTFPLYVLFIEINPAKIDINVHPTKTEIKYQDETAIYAIIRAAVKRSLGLYNLTPSLDFEQETGFERMISPQPINEIKQPSIQVNADFNPFKTDKNYAQQTYNTQQGIPNNWETLYQINTENKVKQGDFGLDKPMENNFERLALADVKNDRRVFQLHNRYIVAQIKSGFMLIDQQAAHERILYERFLSQLDNHKGLSQQMLFPKSVTFNAADFELMHDLLPDLLSIGFQISSFGKNTLMIEGVPADIAENNNLETILEQLLEDYKNNVRHLKLSKRENVARTLAKNAATKAGKQFGVEEMNTLIDQLFACKMPSTSIIGKQIVVTFTLAELAEKFGK
ncbi:MAG: DNA mismatch repair endonuclease MutL [Sphingobacteriales bacterium]|nr:MAG: DNA mismatch repair endonuclease MutL [Sphingobacteriales bacterium]TAF79612.1 MAG: DNA mismatch repair endonuclease MutL [Sphingobacteriales bacterium]